MTNPLQDALNNLTPEERDMLAKSTPQDWADAIWELVKDPTFWQGIGRAFLQGIADGVEDFKSNR